MTCEPLATYLINLKKKKRCSLFNLINCDFGYSERTDLGGLLGVDILSSQDRKLPEVLYQGLERFKWGPENNDQIEIRNTRSRHERLDTEFDKRR